MMIFYTGSFLKFRDQLIAAPLKLGQDLRAEVEQHVIPRSIDRGPIEAFVLTGQFARILQFRDQLIAAPLKQEELSPLTAEYGEFRDQLIAAPLKPVALPLAGECRACSGRSNGVRRIFARDRIPPRSCPWSTDRSSRDL